MERPAHSDSCWVKGAEGRETTATAFGRKWVYRNNDGANASTESTEFRVDGADFIACVPHRLAERGARILTLFLVIKRNTTAAPDTRIVFDTSGLELADASSPGWDAISKNGTEIDDDSK